MSDENEWSQPASPPPPLFLGEKERDYVKQVNDEFKKAALNSIGGSMVYVERTDLTWSGDDEDE